jgi:hypothetical protein
MMMHVDTTQHMPELCSFIYYLVLMHNSGIGSKSVDAERVGSDRNRQEIGVIRVLVDSTFSYWRLLDTYTHW